MLSFFSEFPQEDKMSSVANRTTDFITFFIIERFVFKFTVKLSFRLKLFYDPNHKEKIKKTFNLNKP